MIKTTVSELICSAAVPPKACEVRNCFAPDAFFVLLTEACHHTLLRELFSEAGVTEENFLIACVAPHEVPRYLAAADAGISFRTPGPAQSGASPIKVAEYLAAGLPVVSSAGVGDLDKIIEEERIGVVVDPLRHEAFTRAAWDLIALLKDPAIKTRCRAATRKYFDIDTVAIPRYLSIYRDLLRHFDSKGRVRCTSATL